MGARGGADRPGWHPPCSDTRRKKIVGKNWQRVVEKRGWTGKKGMGWHPRGDDTRVKAIKSDSDSDSDEQKKGRQVFQEKIEGWHPHLPPRVSPTLVTPLNLRGESTDAILGTYSTWNTVYINVLGSCTDVFRFRSSHNGYWSQFHTARPCRTLSRDRLLLKTYLMTAEYQWLLSVHSDDYTNQ